MKQLFTILLTIILFTFLASPALADPRMEILDDFCHYILDPDNTDNEIFLGGCGARIRTVNGKAQGYGLVEAEMANAEISTLKLKNLYLTSDDSDTPCTMVDSNSTEYQSDDWSSRISVKKTYYRDYNRRLKSKLNVRYELICKDGDEQ